MEIHRIPSTDFAEIWEAKDASQNFHAYIALHSLKRGPAIGGLRFWQYPNAAAALEDAQQLARTMTYKAALARLPHGGGKAVMIQPNTEYDRNTLMKLFGQFVLYLQGRYITAKDVGTHAQDMQVIRQETHWVTGLPQTSGGLGDPSQPTALGVALGIEVCLDHAFPTRPKKIRVAVQGLGGVGGQLVGHLEKKGYEIWATDISPLQILAFSQNPHFHSVLPEAILSTPCEVFAPCALGQVLNTKTIPLLQSKIIAGSANNPLKKEQREANALQQRGILYAPDFVINTGGLIHVAAEWAKSEKSSLENALEIIPQNLKEIFDLAEAEHLNPLQAALQRGEKLLRA